MTQSVGIDTILIILATVEAIAEIVTSVWTRSGGVNGKLATTIAVGIGVALVIPSFDLFALFGIAVWPPIAGRVLSGILASRGAKLVHDFLGIVEGYKKSLRNPPTI